MPYGLQSYMGERNQLLRAAALQAAKNHDHEECSELDLQAQSTDKERLYCGSCKSSLLSWG